MSDRSGAVIRSTLSQTASSVADVARSLTLSFAAATRSLMKDGVHNPFLDDVYAPVHEERTLTALSVSGEIPSELDGRYLRNGPNPITAPKAAAHHWFLGDGMLHGVRLSRGEALWYRNRWIRSNAVSRALGEPNAPGRRRLSDLVNTNVVSHAGRTWAVVEAGPYPVRIGPELETIAHDAFGGTLRHGFCAHPHTDPDTGEMHGICYDALNPDINIVRHVVVNTNGDVRREEPIRVHDGPMIHDCMITRSHVLVLDLPVTFSMKRMLAGYVLPYAWNSKHPARVGLLPREGSNRDIIWCDVDPCFVFHPCNAFELADGKVILDVCAQDNVFERTTQGIDSRRLAFERWTIDPASRRVTRSVIDESPQEFPRTNETRIGKSYRYAYSTGQRVRPTWVDPATHLFKHDLETRTRQVHEFGPGKIAGEFIFVPRPEARDEDDGWLMGFVLDSSKQTTDLVILDAARFEERPQARITIPGRIPAGFHGNWIPT